MRHLSFVLVSTHRFDMSRSMFRCESDMKGSEICAANIFICFVPMPESQMCRCPLCKFVLKYFSQQISGHDCKKLLCLCSFLFGFQSEQRGCIFCISELFQVLFQLTAGNSNGRRIDMGAITSQIINTESMRSN